MNSSRYRTLPLEAQYLFRLGMDMVLRRQEERALVFFRQAVLAAPGFTRAYREMGDCLTRMGRGDEAVMYYQKAGCGGTGDYRPGNAVTA